MVQNLISKYLAYGSIALALSPSSILGEIKTDSLEDRLSQAFNEVNTQFELDEGEDVLIIDGETQKIYLVDETAGFRINSTYDISTGKPGFGNKSGSNKTPLGIHKIKEKYGEDALKGSIFKARRNTGKLARIYTEEYDSPRDFVTSRIMWLDGCENDNKNSHSRFIYIHGTPEEGLIGNPASHGCIRMKNEDVIELYEIVDPGTYVSIINSEE